MTVALRVRLRSRGDAQILCVRRNCGRGRRICRLSAAGASSPAGPPRSPRRPNSRTSRRLRPNRHDATGTTRALTGTTAFCRYYRAAVQTVLRARKTAIKPRGKLAPICGRADDTSFVRGRDAACAKGRRGLLGRLARGHRAGQQVSRRNRHRARHFGASIPHRGHFWYRESSRRARPEVPLTSSAATRWLAAGDRDHRLARA